jgi:hypothetical protein
MGESLAEHIEEKWWISVKHRLSRNIIAPSTDKLSNPNGGKFGGTSRKEMVDFGEAPPEPKYHSLAQPSQKSSSIATKNLCLRTKLMKTFDPYFFNKIFLIF